MEAQYTTEQIRRNRRGVLEACAEAENGSVKDSERYHDLREEALEYALEAVASGNLSDPVYAAQIALGVLDEEGALE